MVFRSIQGLGRLALSLGLSLRLALALVLGLACGLGTGGAWAAGGPRQGIQAAVEDPDNARVIVKYRGGSPLAVAAAGRPQHAARLGRQLTLAMQDGHVLGQRTQSLRASGLSSGQLAARLAAGWLASRLGLPLYRVDLASVSSKYIGETEKNLAQLFARAEHAEGVLLFDEADSLFGKRTEVKDANDRFANQQTNYLLQRIESFDGIALLTSNSRARFDSAFTRRLDAIIEFPTPGPDERRALWLAHLGTHHRLDDGQINRVAVACDLAGGHIRNATLTAAAAAPEVIDYPRLCSAIAQEYRKLGRALPAGL
jgi:hypothetical protein